jgi:hypothetical protein
MTRFIPTQDGFYWLNNPKDGTIRIVSIDFVENRGHVWYFGWEACNDLAKLTADESLRWAGPIAMPAGWVKE